MKDNPNNPDDQKLDSLLRQWRCDAPLPPRFRENVWNRIEAQRPVYSPPLWSLVLDWLKSSFPRPALAAAYVTIFLIIGLAGGWVQAQHQNAKINGELETRYLQSIDPNQK
ncbi:MAG: hypothetical protein ACXWBP_03625 [Limisphaerales bacterium]